MKGTTNLGRGGLPDSESGLLTSPLQDKLKANRRNPPRDATEARRHDPQ
ncbi:hypothetical protein HMPREF9946_01388 [Acetobacteraceae bacterium AT-5844]|nr:hypothetical protein HMPREF9946_01388 [Acetobacteraceae bacterium AT-5844]